MGFKKVMSKPNFNTFYCLIGLYDVLNDDFIKFSTTWQLTKFEKIAFEAAKKAINDLTESITNRLDKKFIYEIKPILKNINIDFRSKLKTSERINIFENAWEHTCRNCTLKNWKACQHRRDYLKEEMPDRNGKNGDCEYRGDCVDQ